WARSSVRQARAETTAVRRDLEHSLAMARDTLAIIRSADRIRHAGISLGRQRGGMVLFADDRRHRWNVVIYGVRAPHPDEVLQFWFITERGMVRGVQVPSPRAGPAFLTMSMPPAGGRVMGAALTLEAASARAPEPSGPMLVHLML
ncbi:MAG TPA: anti-sigma factor, partial [Gemmatimonadales bacterium]|nr:anti-sigma factor [Gemmatimonadales bacterium]